VKTHTQVERLWAMGVVHRGAVDVRQSYMKAKRDVDNHRSKVRRSEAHGCHTSKSNSNA
jgi:hypothetical protein